MIVKRGDIFFADLSPVTGSEHGGVRPVLIVQNDIGNRFAPTTIVAAITAQIQKAKLPTHVELKAEKFGLSHDSVVLLEQLRTIDKTRLTERISSISPDDEIMERISFAYQVSGGILPLSEEYTEKTKREFTFKLGDKIDVLEDHEYEFKEIKGRNPKSSISSNVAEYATSFLNSHGGRLFYGISNDRVIKGFQASSEQVDDILTSIYSNLRNIDPGLSSDYYSIIFHPVVDEHDKAIKDVYVLEVGVPATRDKKIIHFNKGKELHIRVNGVKEQLLGSEIVSFIHGRLIGQEN